MPKKQLIEFVNRLKNSGIQVSFTKPKSQYVLALQPTKKHSTPAN